MSGGYRNEWWIQERVHGYRNEKTCLLYIMSKGLFTGIQNN